MNLEADEGLGDSENTVTGGLSSRDSGRCTFWARECAVLRALLQRLVELRRENGVTDSLQIVVRLNRRARESVNVLGTARSLSSVNTCLYKLFQALTTSHMMVSGVVGEDECGKTYRTFLTRFRNPSLETLDSFMLGESIRQELQHIPSTMQGTSAVLW